MKHIEIQLRRALRIGLYSYQHPFTTKQLLQSNIDFTVWKILIKHNCFKKNRNSKIELTSYGLNLASKWFPARSHEILSLHKISHKPVSFDHPSVDYSDIFG